MRGDVGYLKRKISRARCAADVDAAFARQAATLVSRAADAAPSPRGKRRSYLRFAVGRIEPASQHRLGIFRAAGAQYDLEMCLEAREGASTVRRLARREAVRANSAA